MAYYGLKSRFADVVGLGAVNASTITANVNGSNNNLNNTGTPAA
jgi:hypothetical protein